MHPCSQEQLVVPLRMEHCAGSLGPQDSRLPRPGPQASAGPRGRLPATCHPCPMTAPGSSSTLWLLAGSGGEMAVLGTLGGVLLLETLSFIPDGLQAPSESHAPEPDQASGGRVS